MIKKITDKIKKSLKGKAKKKLVKKKEKSPKMTHSYSKAIESIDHLIL